MLYVRVFEGSGGLVESVSESSVNNKWSAATIPHLDSPIRYTTSRVAIDKAGTPMKEDSQTKLCSKELNCPECKILAVHEARLAQH